MDRKLLFLALLALIALAGLSAQAQPAAPIGLTDSKAIALEVGMNTGFSLNTSGLTAGRSFALAFTVSDNLAVGFSTNAAGLTYNALRLAYFVNPALGFSLYMGRSTTPATAAGAGIFYNAFKSRSDAGISTALKVRVEYFFDTTNVGAGDLVLSVGSSFGL